MTDPHYVTRADGVRLAYRHLPGAGPSLVFLPGYKSDMLGTKAIALEDWARRNGRAMLRLDYSGCGESDGAFEEGTLEQWRDDALTVIATVTSGPLLLIGSSMGGWLMLLIALSLRDRLTAMVGIAAAPDFTHWGFSEAEKASLLSDGILKRPSDYGPEPMITTRGFFESGERNLLLGRTIDLTCPVRLLHGQCDADVPWSVSLRLAAALRSADVQTLLVKDGDHRLSRTQDIDMLVRTVALLLEPQ